MKRQNILIVVLILAVLTAWTGYTVFETSVTVKSKTSEVKDFNVIFYKINNIEKVGCTDVKASINRRADKIYIDVSNLMYTGAYGDVSITVKNIGALPAKLDSIEEQSSQNDSIKVNYYGIGVTDITLKPGEKTTFNVRVSLVKDLPSNNRDNRLEFMLKLNYIQA